MFVPFCDKSIRFLLRRGRREEIIAKYGFLGKWDDVFRFIQK